MDPTKKMTGVPKGPVVFLLLSGLFLASSGRADAALTLTPKETVIRDISASGLTLSFQAGVVNDGSAEKRLVRVRYRVTVNRREFLNMDVALEEPVVVPGDAEVLVALPVKITYALLFQAVGAVEGRASCEAAGEMVFESERRREERVAFVFSSDFPIFKDPELEFLPLKVESASLGGAEAVFRVKFKNSVLYELLVDRIRFRLLVDAKEVLEGDIPGDKAIPGGGERVFELPFLVDFFDLGGEVRSKFDEGALPVRFAGEIEIASVWGRIIVPFDRSADVSVSRKP
jgi:LEA14-like dessication related protein